MSATAPPAYEPHSSPPSYDSLVDKVCQLVGSDPTPQKFIDAAATLSESEIEILKDGGDFSDPIKNERDNKVFSTGAAKGLASPECAEHLRAASNAAVEASNEIERLFVSLHLKIAQIDRIHHSGFEPKLVENQVAYRVVLADSRNLATDIAVHGNRFDDMIIPFCFDKSISVDTRRTVLNRFIDQMDTAQADARTMEHKFSELQTNFTSFIADFSVWARDREEQLKQEIARVLEELEELRDKLTSLNTSILALGGGALLLPAVTALAAASGILGPFLAIGGLIALGVSVAAIVSMAALAVAKAATESQIRTKEREKASLENQIEQIRLARQELMDVGEDKLEAFRVNLNVLQSVWTSVAADARLISGYLNGALELAEMPEWMQWDLESANSVYKRMAEYLTNYAKGTPS
ncbi:uncharacterized protein BO72DRAFT_447851 [Aspergillus fijiensis CBS 313.89]|uniref:Uncharacterized protein n=1 Tax=Aspergillus fijiensis CBS 313.89 TaxID=1448319 RepID=A0A8G1RUF9_9EURO|nr:uncharacterized protein BO72DRAFT_447851 [Aspergillus fijiensis CBS 313.89]RAK77726.1 hypothetical protein BO72DRAFT_447851 [Aspergillus fijiensis CBS 313.89]